MKDLNSVNLPGLRLNQPPKRGGGDKNRGTPIKGTEHLHPALERSLRTPALVGRRSPNNEPAGPSTIASSMGLG